MTRWRPNAESAKQLIAKPAASAFDDRLEGYAHVHAQVDLVETALERRCNAGHSGLVRTNPSKAALDATLEGIQLGVRREAWCVGGRIYHEG